ncbi:MAG TPA: pilus assembly protein [Arachnia sp.]|nr:pilus assembly protein [Arachnia sp.]HMR14536.1 pilus assembly protein [Arachnia sp.]
MRRRHADRGLSGSVQLAVLLPFAIGIFLLLLQWSLVTWAEATALAAAQESARAAAAYDGSEAVGAASGAGVAGNGSLTGVKVIVDRGPRQTTATVTGTAVVVLWPRAVSQTASAATERVTTP